MQVRFRPRLLVRIAASLLAAVFAVGALAWFFALPLEAHYWGRKVPVLRQTPAPFRDSAFTESTGRKIAFCGSAFDVPWSDLDEAKTKMGANSTILYFDSGLVVVLKCLPAREFVEGALSSINVSSTNFRRAFGESAVQSDYGLWRLILETTPDAMTLGTPHRRQGAIMAMLVLKATATPPADSGIFAIHTDEFEGFQYQDPHARPKSVLMDLFAQDRGLEFIFLSSYKDASPHLSQADINRIVRTIHKVGPYPPIKQASLTQLR
jgi:hypothetical protein